MKGKRVLVLGYGLQGKAALYDLVKNQSIEQLVVADNTLQHIELLQSHSKTNISFHQVDAGDKDAVAVLMRNMDLVVEALPAPFALPIGEIAVREGVNVVSSMYYVNPAEQNLDKLCALRERVMAIDVQAKQKEIIVLNEFGLDPGIDLTLGVKALSEMERAIEFHSYGAGIPAFAADGNALKYKFSWSPIGVMRTYRRPARYITNGRSVDLRPEEIFEPQNLHVLDIPEIGTALECYFNGDAVRYAEEFGVRESIKEMGRYTCRYPGHSAFWDIVVKCGFLNTTPVKVGEASVLPLEFTAALLESQKQFHYTEHEQDIAMVRIDVRGLKKGLRKRVIYQLVDKRDLETGLMAMQRTVGFMLSLGAELILDGRLTQKGVLGPMNVPYDLLVDGLRQRGIEITRQELIWE
jgi:saccharopine dehydrogenase-like NADP-dependent oxidoreductase